MNVLDLSRLDDLIASKQSADREEVYPDDIAEHCRSILTQTKNDLETQLQLLTLKALRDGDIFHEFRETALESSEFKDKIHYNAIVRLRDNSFSACWVKNIYRQKGASGAKTFSRHVPKGKGHGYLMSKFNKAGKDELGYIELVEGRFAHVRKAAESLRKARAALAEYERDLEKIFETS